MVSGPLLLVGLLAVGILPGYAIETATLRLGTLQGAGWSVRDAVLTIGLLDATHVHLELTAAAAALPGVQDEVGDLALLCASAELAGQRLHCADGQLRLQAAPLGRQKIGVSFSYRLDSGRIETRLRGVRLFDGHIDMTGSYDDGHWQAEIAAEDISLQTFSEWSADAGYAVPVLESDGRIELLARLRGHGHRLGRANAQLRLVAGTFSDAAGTLAGEGLDLGLSAEVQPVASGWRLALDFEGRKGAVYLAPLYIAVPQQAITAAAELVWRPGPGRVDIESFAYHHPGTLRLEAGGQLSTGSDRLVETLDVRVQEGRLPGLYETYVQPWLAGTVLGDLQTAGRFEGQLRWAGDAPGRIGADLTDVTLQDGEGRFGLEGINGRIGWSGDPAAIRSEISWSGGNVYRAALGPSRITVQTGRDHVRLLETATIPVIDGALRIESFSLGFGADTPLHWELDSILTPISMSKLTLALGWPEFGGKLSGVIPAVRYDAGILEVGGVLLVRVFDGTVTLNNLRLERPFGLIPRLEVDAEARDIDLETLTRTFSFGRIEGRLEATVAGLRLESWRPVAFDALIRTPEDDTSRHRISQQAVDTISDIGGGGVGGALSRSFLRIFEEFPYAKLGISCRLENGVCRMGGVEPAEEGYYLVKGRLLPPRLDVIGYADRVDWHSLVSHIMAVTRQQAVGVQ
jgi:hypothetical protein